MSNRPTNSRWDSEVSLLAWLATCVSVVSFLFFYQRGDVLLVDQRVVDGGNRILPDERLSGNLGAEIAGTRAHVAVGQLEPRAGERVRQLVGVLEESPRDLLVGGVDSQGDVGG